MSLKFKILGSSSSGNCGLLSSENCNVLIDVGFSGRKIEKMLAENGLSIEGIQAIFLTHEHGDHALGLRGLAKYQHLSVFANRDTAEAAQNKLTKPIQWKLFENGRPFVFKDLKITPFSVPHDAYDPVGFVFESGDGSLFSPVRSLAWVTDLGYIPNLVREHIRGVELLVIEANYDVELLEQDEKRPFSVKQRIRGRHGHLSNTATFELLNEMDNPRWRQVCLAHLSRDCNSVDSVKRQFASLKNNGCRFGIDIIDPEKGISRAFNLAEMH